MQVSQGSNLSANPVTVELILLVLDGTSPVLAVLTVTIKSVKQVTHRNFRQSHETNIRMCGKR